MVCPLLRTCWTCIDNICLRVLKSCTDFEVGEVLLLQKPLYWTSFDLVNKVKMAIRHHCGLKKLKVGHAGTLDPLATGLMGFIGFILLRGEQITAIFLFFRTLFALGLIGLGVVLWLEKPVQPEVHHA